MNTFNALYMALSGITDFMKFLELKNKSITYKVYGTSLQIDAIIKNLLRLSPLKRKQNCTNSYTLTGTLNLFT